MFDFVAKRKRVLMLILIIFIVPPFAFWGIESYQSFFSTRNDVASIDGQNISERELTEQVRQQQDRMRALLGTNFDAAAFDSPEIRERILSNMIDQRLLLSQALRGNLTVTDEQLRAVIASTPAFQEGNRFSQQRYQETLGREGYTPVTFEASLRRDLVLQQYTNAITETGVTSKSTAQNLAEARAEQREVSEYTVSASQFVPQIRIEEQAVRAYYDANRSQFLVPERVKVEYVVFSRETMQARETVGDEEVKSWYESHIDQYREKEERRASHILISVKPGADDKDKAKAREKAQTLLNQVAKSPASFGEIANKNSDDPGSSAKGGDLGYFSRGMMVKAFEDAAFQLGLNETSGLVESEFGFHIIRVTDIKAAKTRDIPEVRAEIERELKKQRAGRKFAEAAETLSNLVYEQPDSFKPVEEKFELAVQTSGWISRQSSPVKVLNHPRLLSALFTDDAIKKHHNTEAIEVSPGTLVSARVIEHKTASTKAIADVRGDIVRQLTQKESTAMAHKKGIQMLEELRRGNAAAVSFGSIKTLSRNDPKGASHEALAEIFSTDRKKVPAYAGVELPDGYLLLRVGKVIEAKVSETDLKNLQTELARASGGQQLQALLASLREGAKVEINKERLEKANQ